MFKEDFRIPITEGDTFQFEYFHSSRSVFLAVVSDIFYTITLIGLEFALSMVMIDKHLSMAQSNTASKLNWVTIFTTDHQVFTYFVAFARLSFLISCLNRLLTLDLVGHSGITFKRYYTLMFLIYLV